MIYIYMGVSENVVYPIFPMVLLIIIPSWKMASYHWEYILFKGLSENGVNIPNDS